MKQEFETALWAVMMDGDFKKIRKPGNRNSQLIQLSSMRIWATHNAHNQMMATFYLTEIFGCQDRCYRHVGEFMLLNCVEIAEMPPNQQLVAIQLAYIAFGKARDTRKPGRWLKRYEMEHRHLMAKKSPG